MGDFSVKATLSAVDKNFASTMRGAVGYANNLKSTITSGFGFGIMMGAGQKAFQSISSGVTGLIGELNSAGASWKTFQGNMQMNGKTSDEIKSIKNELSDFATKTIYSASDMASTFAQLDAVGTKNTTSLVKGFGGLAAAAENPTQAMKTLSQQATQMAAKPTVAWQDFKLMLEQTPAGIAAVAKTMGMSTTDLIKNIQDGTVATEDFLDAVAKTGTNANFTKLATEYKTVGQAADGLTETISNKLQPAFGKVSSYAISAVSKITDSFDAIDGEALVGKISSLVDKITPYWNVFKENAIEVKDAFGNAFSAIGESLGELTGAFGSTESISSFSDVIGTAADALKKFAGFLEENSDTVAKVITVLPKLLLAYKGFRVVSAIAPGIALFSKGIMGLAGKGVGAIAGKLLGIAGAQTTVGTASATSASAVMKAALAFLAMGAGVLLISAGIGLLVFSAVQLAQAGPMAAVALLGLVAVVALFAAGAALLGPALTAGAVGFVAFGIAIALVGLGALLAATALMIVAGVLPTVVTYGEQGAIAIALLGAGMIAFAVGAALAGVAAIVLGAGLLVVGLALAVVGVAVLVVAAGVMLLAAGAVVLGAGMLLTGAALMIVASTLPTVAAGALMSTVALAAMLVTSLLLSASLLLLSVPLLLIGPAFLLASAGAVSFGIAMAAGAVGVGAMALALKTVNSSMKSIASNAKAAQKSISSMKASVNIVSDGLEALGSKAKSAVNNIIDSFSSASGNAKSAATTMMNGFNAGITSGGIMAIASANSISNSVLSALRTAESGAYNCGYYIGIGLANGMSATLSYVESVATQLAAAAEKAVRAKAQIHSPSRISTKLGKYWGVGFVGGIKDMFGEVKRTSRNMIDMISSPDVPSFAGIGSYSFGNRELSNDYTYNPVVYVKAEVTSELNGKKVGYGTAEYVQEKNDRIATLKRQMNGQR